LIEDPAQASAIAHALQILCRRWEADRHGVTGVIPVDPGTPYFVP
jgi:hypothetical protein